jgi:hypothetical protein
MIMLTNRGDFCWNPADICTNSAATRNNPMQVGNPLMYKALQVFLPSYQAIASGDLQARARQAIPARA